MTEEGVAAERGTLGYLISRTRRAALPLRHAFVHNPKPGGGPGPLSWFLRRPDTLDLYLLMRAVAVHEPYNVLFPNAVWSRALGRGSSSAGELWVSKSLHWLEHHSLIRRKRAGRLMETLMLHDAGTGEPYQRPAGGKAPLEWFFRFSHAYFLQEWHKHLSASGKAVLLIAHASKPEFTLPLRQGAEWWGVSSETLARGIDELKEHKLLAFRTTRKTAWNTRLGYTLEPHYALKEPFRKAAGGRSKSSRS
jgi:hypothetical protein